MKNNEHFVRSLEFWEHYLYDLQHNCDYNEEDLKEDIQEAKNAIKELMVYVKLNEE